MRDRRKEYRRRQDDFRDVSASRKASGISFAGRIPPADVEARMAEIPDEQRDLTGQMFGDPPPRDPRRTWAPHLAGDA